jgi:hypothetical protein
MEVNKQNLMTLFILAVAAMRKEQRLYAATQDRATANKVRRLEREVDELISQLQAKQKSLFTSSNGQEKSS